MDEGPGLADEGWHTKEKGRVCGLKPVHWLGGGCEGGGWCALEGGMHGRRVVHVGGGWCTLVGRRMRTWGSAHMGGGQHAWWHVWEEGGAHGRRVGCLCGGQHVKMGGSMHGRRVGHTRGEPGCVVGA